MSKLSIIIPVYYSAETLMDCYVDLKAKVLDVLAGTDDSYELIMVDDGSKDDSYKIMREIAAADPNARCIKLSRNFGEYAAVYAGFDECTGECATIRAADCQEPSELILDMFESWKKGNKVVIAVRSDRHDKVADKLFASIYYGLVRKLINKSMPKGGFDRCLIDRDVIDALKSLGEANPALPLQILWTGFSVSFVPYVRLARTKGHSRWTFKKKINLVLDSFIGFSSFPIRLLSIVGVIAFFASLVWAVWLVVEYFTVGTVVQGWTMLACMILFSTGLIMLSLAVISEYIWRILDASRGRPVYIIDRQSDDKV